jgi:arylmalonate decarboxylase
MAEPVLGLIVPRTVEVPSEAITLYPGVRFLIEAVGLEFMTPAGYDSVLDRIVPTAQALARRGAQAIVLVGTSLTFYKGAAFNESLAESIRCATGLPSTTMSTAMVDGLKAVGAHRIAVATAYNHDVTERLRNFLTESGFDVRAAAGLGLERIGEAGQITSHDLQKFVTGVFESAPECDAMLVSCGGFCTLELIDPLERACGIPVISSMPHGLWAGVRLLGLSGAAPGYGTLLSNGPPGPPKVRA